MNTIRKSTTIILLCLILVVRDLLVVGAQQSSAQVDKHGAGNPSLPITQNNHSSTAGGTNNIFLPLINNNGTTSGVGTPTPPALTTPALPALQCTAAVTTSAPLIPLQSSDAGYTAGQLNVSQSGAAHYQIGIFTPPGTAGMKPDISLVFDSQSREGLVGVGWSLGGLSSIARCPATLERNQRIDGVDFDENDQLCLDGQPLVIEQGVHGADGSVYRTELDSFSRITAYGNSGQGPQSFKVQTKAGLTMAYGSTADARLQLQGRAEVLTWALNRVEDTKGNYFTISYATDPAKGEQYPATIAYTANDQANLSSDRRVEFIYENRPDPTSHYLAGATIQASKRLQQIDVRAGNDLVRQYQMAYEVGAISGRSRLTSVTECTGNGTCLPPTRFQWQEGSRGFVSQTWTANTPVQMRNSGGTSADYQTISADFTGDGKADLATIARRVVDWIFNPLPRIWQRNILVEVATGSSFISQTWPAVTPGHMLTGGGQTSDYQIIPGDYNADGKIDLATVNRPSGYNGWSEWVAVELSTGSSFDSQTWSAGLPQHMWNGQGTTADYVVVPGDFNGDGLTDLAGVGRALGENGWKENIYVELSTGTGFISQPWRAGLPQHLWNGNGKTTDYRIFPGDFNGDGLTDIAAVSRALSEDNGWRENVYVELSTGQGFTSHTWRANTPQHMWNGGGTTLNYQVIPVDLNGDGLTDLATVGRAVGNNAWKGVIFVELSTGTGFVSQAWPAQTPGHMYNGNEATTDFRVAPGDFNGDGRTDLATIGRAPTVDNGWRTNFYLEFSTGQGFVSEIWPADTAQHMYNGGSETSEYQTLLGSFDGDNKTDILTIRRAAAGSGWSEWVAVELPNAQYPDLLKQITNGHGLETQIEYSLLTDSSVYTKNDTGFYPQVDLQLPFYVVSAIRQSNGIGGMAAVHYHYDGLKVNVRGRGLLGFRQVRMTDAQTGIQTTSTYHQNFPYTGLLAQSEQRQAEGALISSVANHWQVQETVAQASFFPYVARSESKQYELAGTLVNTTTTSSEYDAFGNPTWVQVNQSDGWSQSTKNSYEHDLNRWFLARLTRTEVTARAPNQLAQTRTASFAYDGASGLLIREVTEPDNPQLRLVKEYEHDRFGNIVRTTTSGEGFTSRSQQSEYDEQGRFSIKTSNALGQSETRQYAAWFGSPTTTIGPNQLHTRSEYDGFGRLTQTIEADGTQTVQFHRRCANGACPPHAVYFTQINRTGAGPVIQYFDLLDRIIREETQGIDGRAIYLDTEYNERGRVKRASEPYFKDDTPQWTQYEYDLLGRVVKQTFPDNSALHTQYQGFTTTITNALAQQQVRTLNSQGDLVRSIDNAGNAITYEYDVFGNLTQLRDPAGNLTIMEYDLRGRKVKLSDPDTGTTFYRYNPLSELIWQQDANGNQVAMHYDLLGRMMERTELEGQTTWAYDTAPMGIGKISRITGPDGYQEIYSYDQFGRNAKTTFTLAGQSYDLCQTFDTYGRVDKVVYPTGFTLQQHYAASGQLLAVSNPINGVRYWQADQVNARGQTAQETLGNGLVTGRTYDPRTGYLQTIQTGRNGTPTIQDLSYHFDAIGNLTARRDLRQNLTESFGYDNLNRLTQWQVSGQPPKSATYDALGNITFRSDVGRYSYGDGNAKPHAVAAVSDGGRNNSYRYDANGNRIASNDSTITYTSYNKPSKIVQKNNEVTFAYNPARNIYQKTTGENGQAVLTFIIGGLFEIDVTPTLTAFRHAIRGSDGVVATYTQRSDGVTQTHYLHRDHLGSLDAITDEAGNVVERLSFDAWGKRRLPNWQDTDEVLRSVLPRGYTGHEQLDAVSLIHMDGRVYDPLIGRFLSADPFVQAPDNLQSLNRYSYVLNNPLSYVDPSGYLFKDLTKAIKKAFGAVEDFFKDNWKVITVAAITIVTATFGGPIVASFMGFAPGTFGAAVIGGATAGFAGGFSEILLNGGGLSQAFSAGGKGALVGGLTGGAFFGIGEILGHQVALGSGSHIAKITGHGIVGGVSSKLQGEKFAHGFLSGAFTQAFAPTITEFFPESFTGRVVASAVVGGTAAELGGGKFANGAVTGAFSRLFNDEIDREKTSIRDENLRDVSKTQGSTTENGRSSRDLGQASKLPNESSTDGRNARSLKAFCTFGSILTRGRIKC